MLDFMRIATQSNRRGQIEVYPKFIIKKSKDLMIRGGDFYAVWIEEIGLWSTEEQDAIDLIDVELDKYVEENKSKFDSDVRVMHMWDAECGKIDAWHKYCQKQMRDNFRMLDEKLIFSNSETNKKDYASKRLPYPLEPGSIQAWDKLISTLYSEEERRKIEWAIGSIVHGDSRTVQKFMALYGSGGTGKSTVLNIIQQLFEGYCSVFDAKALGSASNSFALEAFKTNPLVAIQHDGDLSKIEDNTRLNSLISHELMTVNEKFKPTYSNSFKCFLFIGTNKPVKITDAKSGLIRRLIDVSPTGNTVDEKEYKQLVKQVSFELGAIAHHCQGVYLSDPGMYDDYVPAAMLSATNDFYNFIVDFYHVFKKEDGTSLKAAWEMYKTYCEDAKVLFPYSRRNFQEELKNYFWNYENQISSSDGFRIQNYYSGFRTDKFETEVNKKKESTAIFNPFTSDESIFDLECADNPAQYATTTETPYTKWDDVTTKLSEIDTRRIHYVKLLDEQHIVVDFDLKDEKGNKSLEKNLEAASKWPPTYGELSKSGVGVHLHYIYTGNVSTLSRLFAPDIEIKIFTGKSSLRRKFTKSNGLPIAKISSGLPLKGAKKVISGEVIKNERMLREMVKRNLNKEIHPATKPSIDFIRKILDDAYSNGFNYDVSDMYNEIFAFAANSTNQANTCIKLLRDMKFKSDEPSIAVDSADSNLIFYDVEVFPNLFIVNWKVQGEDNPVIRMINPSSSKIEELLKYKLVGFNCRRYDNHILYGRLMGYSLEQLYNLSQRIISGDRNAFFGEAYNLSHTDVYDFCSKKQSLKKWEIELGLHHQELGLPWDKPVPEELWEKVAEYCDNDVIATEAVFDARQADFIARKIQVDLVTKLHVITSVTVNDTTNTLSTKIIFGNNRKPQSVFNWRDLSQPVSSDRYDEYRRKFGNDYKFRVFDDEGLPLYRDYIPGETLPRGQSILPFFKGYTYDYGKSIYMGEEIGEGGRVFSRPGMYPLTWDGDVVSQHPHSAILERVFGPEFTRRFQDIVEARVAIKHKDFDKAGKLLGGALKPYLNEDQAADLAQALKIVINSIYGLTSASFENPFRDPNNKDNIVAKRGALFMTLLKSEVEKRGYTVAHIKTDSIKIPNATQEIIDFVMKFGLEFGYAFETEANFEKFCLVNDAVYIAKFADGKNAGKWTATGTQFAVPYVFKTLFSREPIVFEDMCETKSVSTALYLDMNEELPDVSGYENELTTIKKNDKSRDFKETLDISFGERADELEKMISQGHDYHFVGKIGQFCPIKPGRGGGLLCREKDGNYYAATGSKGYRWLESEMVRTLNKDEDIDRSYYNNLVNDAVETISKYGDFDWFVADDPVGPEFEMKTPPWVMSCGRESCNGCPNFNNDLSDMKCLSGYDISDLIRYNQQ